MAKHELTSSAYSWDKRLEVVSRYMLLGNLRLISEQTGVSYDTLCDWKKSEWWPETVAQIKREKKNKTNDSLTKIIEQSLEVMTDRLEHGDFIMNNKTGEIVRKPVGVKEATAITSQLLQRQLQIEEMMERTERSTDTVNETLALLAREFQKWNKKLPQAEVVDVVAKEPTSAIHDQRQA